MKIDKINIMKTKDFVFAGFIKDDWSGDFRTIKLVDENVIIDLVKKFRGIFDLFNEEVNVSYFISDTKKTEIEIKEAWLKNLESYHYSSWTNGIDYNTYLSIGGHDLFNEFKDYKDKWCVLKISFKLP